MTGGTQPRRHDMPPKWDGAPVTWSEWTGIRSTLALHAKPEQMACRKCGTVDESLVCFGTRQPAEDTELGPVQKWTRSGKPYEVVQLRPARAVRDLWATRCRHCGQDQVEDKRTGDLWDLGPEDYGPDGSTPADTLF